MNNVNESLEPQISALVLMWRNGELASEKLQGLLAKAVEIELTKPDDEISMKVVEYCESVLWELQGNDLQHEANHKDEIWKVVRQQLRKNRSLAHKHKIGVAFGLAMLIVIGMVVLENVLPNGFVSTYSTPDEQLYIVEGKETRVILVPSAMASLGVDEDLSIQTTNLDEIDAFFGFRPPMPQTFPTGWKIAEYEGHISQIKWTFMLILFSDTQDYHTTYQITVNTTYKDIGTAYHQNEAGNIVELPNGFSGYLSSNMEDTFITWQDGLISYDISGPILADEVLVMVESIK